MGLCLIDPLERHACPNCGGRLVMRRSHNGMRAWCQGGCGYEESAIDIDCIKFGDADKVYDLMEELQKAADRLY